MSRLLRMYMCIVTSPIVLIVRGNNFYIGWQHLTNSQLTEYKVAKVIVEENVF